MQQWFSGSSIFTSWSSPLGEDSSRLYTSPQPRFPGFFGTTFFGVVRYKAFGSHEFSPCERWQRWRSQGSSTFSFHRPRPLGWHWCRRWPLVIHHLWMLQLNTCMDIYGLIYIDIWIYHWYIIYPTVGSHCKVSMEFFQGFENHCCRHIIDFDMNRSMQKNIKNRCVRFHQPRLNHEYGRTVSIHFDAFLCPLYHLRRIPYTYHRDCESSAECRGLNP